MAVTAIALVGISPCPAADWEWRKGLSAGVLYTDNADTSDGENAGETILSVSPFARLDVSGKRSELALSSQFELERHVDDERTEFSPQVTATSRTVIVDRFASLGASARVSQRSIEGSRLVGDAGSLNEEKAEIYQFSISPTISDTLADRGRYSVGYRFAATRGSDDALRGSDQHGVESRFAAAVGTFPLVVLAGANYETTRFETDDSARAASVAAGLGYAFSQTLRGFIGAGYDDIRVVGADDDQSGATWATYFRWHPNQRFEAKIGYAERSFGSQPSASIRLTGRRSSVNFSWSRAANYADDSPPIDLAIMPGDVPDAQLSNSGSDAVDSSSLADTVDDELVDDSRFSPLVRDGAAVDERVGLTYALRGRITHVHAGIDWARRTRPDSDLTTKERRYSLGATRKLSRTTDLVARYTKLETNYSDDRNLARENRYELVIRVFL